MLVEADIRGFKFINQNYGEEAADKVILYYSKALNKMSADYHAIIGRGFADHFYTLIRVSSVRKSMNIFKERIAELTETIIPDLQHKIKFTDDVDEEAKLKKELKQAEAELKQLGRCGEA